MSKDKYKVLNWRQYNQGLKQRGALTVWIDKAMLQQWYYQGARKKGGQFHYSDKAIEICLLVRLVYHLPLRQTQGFIESFFGQLQVALSVPDYSTLCRRCARLYVNVKVGKGKALTDIVFDSTGLRVYGEGEWKVRLHGWSKHRSWMKLHVGLDAAEQQVEVVELSDNTVDDGEMVEKLLHPVNRVINSVTGDGAYDQIRVRKAIEQKALAQGEDILQLIALKKNAVLDKKQRACLQQRNDDIIQMHRLGRQEWKIVSDYHQRSKVETFMYRYKVILGGSLRAREYSRQETEVKLGCKILNLMLKIAKPQSEKVA